MWQPPLKKPLRQRIRDAGGFYLWVNAALIRAAGPPQIGVGTQPRCRSCGALKYEHVLVDDGLGCPDSTPA
ncbi:hypothetical protein [Microbacterium halotolerans]|uniref:hypothetical protein n=1 Tax=Microbacterium halotolerans TaxID=246613 RepID=UPI000E6AB67F|nr:hypothetical protein [Microbacterium halotolerans]